MMIAAIAPDLDYFVPFLHKGEHDGLRISHSIAFTLILLTLTVGVHPMPLFWPLIDETFRSPIGLLPSSGALSFTNDYFYRNLAIELGVLIPILAVIQLALRGRFKTQPRWLLLAALAMITLACMYIAFSLSRS